MIRQEAFVFYNGSVPFSTYLKDFGIECEFRPIDPLSDDGSSYRDARCVARFGKIEIIRQIDLREFRELPRRAISSRFDRSWAEIYQFDVPGPRWSKIFITMMGDILLKIEEGSEILILGEDRSEVLAFKNAHRDIVLHNSGDFWPFKLGEDVDEIAPALIIPSAYDGLLICEKSLDLFQNIIWEEIVSDSNSGRIGSIEVGVFDAEKFTKHFPAGSVALFKAPLPAHRVMHQIAWLTGHGFADINPRIVCRYYLPDGRCLFDLYGARGVMIDKILYDVLDPIPDSIFNKMKVEALPGLYERNYQ
jgi:hypothetical protein